MGGGEHMPDWRSQIHPASRERLVNKILETLKRHLPYSGEEGLLELRKIAVRFDEKCYNAATDQTDYLRRISQKMMSVEPRTQNTIPASTSNGNNPFVTESSNLRFYDKGA